MNLVSHAHGAHETEEMSWLGTFTSGYSGEIQLGCNDNVTQAPAGCEGRLSASH